MQVANGEAIHNAADRGPQGPGVWYVLESDVSHMLKTLEAHRDSHNVHADKHAAVVAERDRLLLRAANAEALLKVHQDALIAANEQGRQHQGWRNVFPVVLE
jgi:hypothetical protein